MDAIFRIIAEALSLFRITKEAKKVEIQQKNKEIFVERQVKQDEVAKQDNNEKLVQEVVSSSGEERKKKLDEIRKIISK
ncbi:MAG: hypothetical protein RLZ10_940 [Bacteroidota bacterium]|jgi:hypothetical protein